MTTSSRSRARKPMPKAKSKARGITEPAMVCPYTGQTLVAVYDDDTKHSGWYLVGGLDMSIPFMTKEELYVANTSRMGRKNIAQSLKCAYFGTPLKAVENRGLWYAVPVDLVNTSMFTTSERHASKDKLLWLLSHRNGIAPDFKEPKPVEVKHADEPHEHFVDTTEGFGHNSDDEAEEFVDKLTWSV